jgi:hypothetical protein
MFDLAPIENDDGIDGPTERQAPSLPFGWLIDGDP